MTKRSEKQFNSDSAKYNKLYQVDFIARYYQRQNSTLLRSEAVAQASHDFDRGLRWSSREGCPV
jgi:hypothetical protein